MRIDAYPVTSFVIDDIMKSHKLDPVRVTFEDIAPGKGRITVVCFSRAWTAYWGSMGTERTVEQFTARQDSDYLAGCLDCGNDTNDMHHLSRVAWAMVDACRERVQ